MTATPICAWCKQPAKGLATIGDDHYCHEGDSPTCYELAQQAASNGGDGFLGRLLADQHRQWQERHGDPTFAGAQAFARLHEDQHRDAVREFANWVSTQRAYNGSEHEHGQSLYNECINAVLPTWAEEWAAEQAPAPIPAMDACDNCDGTGIVAIPMPPGFSGGQVESACPICRTNSVEQATRIEDGFGGVWATCGPGCDLQVVRPGKVQCNRKSAACPDASQDDDAYEAYAYTCPICAQPGPEEPRLREEEHELLFDALGDFGTNSPEVHPDLPEIGSLIGAVVPVVERILAKRLAAVEQERDGWKRAYEVTDRRVTGHVQERATLVQRLHASEQARELAMTEIADAVAKFDALAAEKQRLSERAANDIITLINSTGIPHPHVLGVVGDAAPNPVGTTTTEWGVLQNDGYVSHAPFLTEEMARAAAQHHAPPETIRVVVSRTRTSYPDHVTDWQETS